MAERGRGYGVDVKRRVIHIYKYMSRRERLYRYFKIQIGDANPKTLKNEDVEHMIKVGSLECGTSEAKAREIFDLLLESSEEVDDDEKKDEGESP